MCISKYNGEGYIDLTMHDALEHIEQQAKAKYRPLVYICSPYAGDTQQNTLRAEYYCRCAVEQGYIPIAPHIYFPRFIREETERQIAMQMNMVLLGKCLELWAFGDNVTAGMKAEIAKAKSRAMRIRWFTADLEEIVDGT